VQQGAGSRNDLRSAAAAASDRLVIARIDPRLRVVLMSGYSDVTASGLLGMVT
jgi:hypothetical protein